MTILKVFGCKVFFYLPKSFRNKFDNNSLSGIFLGYSNYGYKIFDITNNKIILSRSVDFFENDLGFNLNFYPQNLIPMPKLEGNYNNNPITNTPLNTKKRKEPFKSYQITKKVKIYTVTPQVPVEFDDIFELEDKDLWLKAVQDELMRLNKMNVYKQINKIPINANLISCRWVFTYKRDLNGNIIKRKARLVVRGFTQQIGIDFKETFSPTLKQDSFRIITAISVQLDFRIEQIDINSAYLNAELEEEIYMEIPEGHPSHGKAYWKLNKALYGLKQAGKA